VVVAVVAALGAAVWALGDPSPNPGGLGALPAPARGTTVPTLPADEGLSTPTAGANQPVGIAPGVTLWPGDDGQLPVSVRWVRHLYGPEAIAVDGDTAYAADIAFNAFDVADGSLRWRTFEPTGEGFDADGGVLIGTQEPDQVRVRAPFDYDLTVDRNTGEIDDLAPGGTRSPQGFAPLPAPRPTAFRVHVGTERVVARDATGHLRWQISVDEPVFDPMRAVGIPGGLLVVASSGDLVALDVPAPA
jgi:outer membrane protein assembly factor BamB